MIVKSLVDIAERKITMINYKIICRYIAILTLAIIFILLSACGQKTAVKVNQEFDEQNRVIKETTFIRGQFFDTVTYQYASNGDCIRENHYNAEDLLIYYLIFDYDEKGQQIRRTQYQDDEMFVETTMEYDINGRMTRSDDLTYQGGKSYCLYFYDENGVLAESKTYSVYSDGDCLTYVDKYDANGNQISSSHYVTSGALDYTKKWEYDTNGNVKKVTEYDRDGNIMTSQTY